MLVICCVWGGNMAAIKIGSKWLAPAFGAAVRSAVAALLLFVWMRFKGVPLFPSRSLTVHGLVVGLLFGVEFAFIFMGLQYTLASRAYVYIYTHPFVVALGAHFIFSNDRLNPPKALGLSLAFGGVALLFADNWGTTSSEMLRGDVMLLLGGFFWGCTTLYIKKFIAGRAVALQTLFYQLAFSAPVLFAVSLAMEENAIAEFQLYPALAVAYQCVIVAFISYLAWFELMGKHPVSLLAAFTFFAPVLGVFISGVLILGEPLSANFFTSLALVAAGMILVNTRAATRGPKAGTSQGAAET
jgi:drug/metabolite transporter (DMT)-like permease